MAVDEFGKATQKYSFTDDAVSILNADKNVRNNLKIRRVSIVENYDDLYDAFDKFPKRVCEYCGKEYWPNVAHQKYCCKECGKKASRTDAKGPENMSVIPALLETAGA